MTNRKLWTLILPVLSLLVLAGVARGTEVHPYKDPLPLFDYVDDIEPILQRSFALHGWKYEAPGDGKTYKGSQSLKGFEIFLILTVRDKQLVVDVEKAYMTDCTGNCADLRREEHVERWVGNLRRTIAIEVTTLVRDALAKQDE